MTIPEVRLLAPGDRIAIRSMGLSGTGIYQIVDKWKSYWVIGLTVYSRPNNDWATTIRLQHGNINARLAERYSLVEEFPA